MFQNRFNFDRYSQSETICRSNLDPVELHCYILLIFSSPEPKAIGELIVYPCFGVRRCRRCGCRRPPFSNVFSSETAWPSKAKFYVESPWEGETKVYLNRPGHMTMMAAMPIYGKNLKKSSSPEPAVL